VTEATEQATEAAIARPAPQWSEVEVGQRMPPFVDSPLTITDFVRYQGAANDTAFARAAGYPGPFAVGMRQAGVLADYAVRVWGSDNVRRFGVQFRDQAWPGDVLTYTGSVVAKRDEVGGRQVELELSAVRQTGQVHIRGWATFVVPG
jgi:acyl dehydratase